MLLLIILPAPIDVPDIKGTLDDGTEEVFVNLLMMQPFSALAFKIMTDPYVGKLTFFRVYSGILEFRFLRSELQRKANVSVSVVFCKCMRTAVKKSPIVYAGDIAAAVGLKDTTTGDTLCDEKNPVILESMNFPDPVISGCD